MAPKKNIITLVKVRDTPGLVVLNGDVPFAVGDTLQTDAANEPYYLRRGFARPEAQAAPVATPKPPSVKVSLEAPATDKKD